MPEPEGREPRRMVVGFMVDRHGLRGPGVFGPGRLTFGLVVLGLGVLFMLDHMGWLSAHEVLRWWPALILAYGLSRILGWGARPHLPSGVLFTLIGSVLLLQSLQLLRTSVWDLWPLLLILLGISLVTGTLRRRTAAARDVDDSSATLNATAIWAGMNRKVVAQDFRGGEITAIMGGFGIDLRGAAIAGDSATIHIFTLWGGVDLKVPEEWNVVMAGAPILGVFTNSAKSFRQGDAAAKTLFIRGAAIMGGVEVKN